MSVAHFIRLFYTSVVCVAVVMYDEELLHDGAKYI